VVRSAGFFVPENMPRDAEMALEQIAGARRAGGEALVWIGGRIVVALAMALRRRSSALIVLSLVHAMPRFRGAFYRGHPFRIRYMVPLMAIEAIGAGLVSGAVSYRSVPRRVRGCRARGRGVRAAPLDPTGADGRRSAMGSPELAGARARHRVHRPARARRQIMASMGSLGHTCRKRRDPARDSRFFSRRNGDIWLAALQRPQPFAPGCHRGESAGGDMLARIARESRRSSRATSACAKGRGSCCIGRCEGLHGKHGNEQAHGSTSTYT